MIDNLAWIYIRDRRVLLTRSRGKSMFYLPGGKRETGETDVQALVREIREELSTALVPDTLRYVGTFEGQAHGQPDGVMVRMTCYSGDASTEVCAAAEIEELAWLTSAERERCAPTARRILDRLKLDDLID